MLPSTAAFLEILVIGIQSLAWTWFAAAAVLGTQWWSAVQDLPDALLVGALGLIAYALGVLVDRVADGLDDLLAVRLAGDYPPVPIMRLRMMTLDDGRARFLEYQRSRLRIARSTGLNLVLVAGTSAWFMVVQVHLRPELIAGISAILIVLSAVAVQGTRQIQSAYDRRLADAYAMWERDGHQEEAERDRKAKLAKIKKK
jgi:hypothetical protein